MLARNASRVVRQCSASQVRHSSTLHPAPRTVFSGIQPTGVPHLGNYLGALRNWVHLQSTAGPGDTLLFSIVGLHALTLPQDPATLRRERREMMAALLAIGLDPQRCIVYHQDQVPEHAELAWILNCLTPVGKLRRMTTWKAKLATARSTPDDAGIDESHLSLGLLAYPVLQAADILLYKATHVPVGEDQVQHLELARDVADLFNRTYKRRTFPLPAHIITPTKRVLSLRDPTQKMSKSSPDASSRILLTDTPEQVRSKVRRAVTDSETGLSYAPAQRPGVSNLLRILAALRGGGAEAADPAHIAAELDAAGGSGARLKDALTDAVVETLRPIQATLARLKREPAYLAQLEESGRLRAQQRARDTMREVRRCVGLA